MYKGCMYVIVYLLEKKNIKNYNNTIYHLIPIYAYLYSYAYTLMLMLIPLRICIYIPMFDTFQKQEAGGTTNVLTSLYAHSLTFHLFDICL